jgi:hypothetical protein
MSFKFSKKKNLQSLSFQYITSFHIFYVHDKLNLWICLWTSERPNSTLKWNRLRTQKSFLRPYTNLVTLVSLVLLVFTVYLETITALWSHSVPLILTKRFLSFSHSFFVSFLSFFLSFSIFEYVWYSTFVFFIDENSAFTYQYYPFRVSTRRS